MMTGVSYFFGNLHITYDPRDEPSRDKTRHFSVLLGPSAPGERTHPGQSFPLMEICVTLKMPSLMKVSEGFELVLWGFRGV